MFHSKYLNLDVIKRYVGVYGSLNMVHIILEDDWGRWRFVIYDQGFDEAKLQLLEDLLEFYQGTPGEPIIEFYFFGGAKKIFKKRLFKDALH
jgi:hypothetical protein